jgi:phage terminase small subunit
VLSHECTADSRGRAQRETKKETQATTRRKARSPHSWIESLETPNQGPWAGAEATKLSDSQKKIRPEKKMLKPVVIPARKPKEKLGTPPPRGLSAEARSWWQRLSGDYEISDAAGLLLLETALRAFDRVLEARRVLKADGPLVRDRFRQLKPHPALAVERDAALVLLKCLRELHLDLEPVLPIGRPPGR